VVAMSISVHEVLKLEKFNKFRLIAGANGLDRRVARGGFIDHETIEKIYDSPDFEREMIFSNMPMVGGNPEEITAYIEALIHMEVACFAMKTVFFDAFPQSAIDLANAHHFPLLLFDETYIEKLVIDIDEAVNQTKKLEKKRELIKRIEKGAFNQHLIRTYTKEINPHFKDFLTLISIYSPDDKFVDRLTIQKIIGKQSLILQLDKVYLLMLSTDEEDQLEVDGLLETLGVTTSDFVVGLSDYYIPIESFDEALNQSRTALKYAVFKERDRAAYDEIGIFQLVIPILSQPQIQYYYRRVCNQLMDYDKKHQSNLMETACAYVHNDGDIKQTAVDLFQHINTVRYRIRKIFEILNLPVGKGLKYETLALAIHIYELNKREYKLNLL